MFLVHFYDILIDLMFLLRIYQSKLMIIDNYVTKTDAMHLFS